MLEEKLTHIKFLDTKEAGYIAEHIRVTSLLMEKCGFNDYKIDNKELRNQACEDYARWLLISSDDRFVPKIEEAIKEVALRYEFYTKNPETARATAASVRH